MSDFLKIFFIVCATAVAFFFGKGYGEQTFFVSEHYKNIAKTREELDYARSELENAKAKLQNILSSAENQKTDELLAKILQVFLADLGLQIQNRDLILEQARNQATADARLTAAQIKNLNTETPAKEISKAEMAIQKMKEAEKLELKKLEKFKSNEEKLVSSDAPHRHLDKVVIKNLKTILAQANPEATDCSEFIGKFRGDFVGVTNKREGSIIFEVTYDQKQFAGYISWLKSPNPPISTSFNGGCGLVVPGIHARFFTLSDNLYLQVYPNNKPTTGGPKPSMSGIMYQVLPAGSTQKIGTFWIKMLL